LLKFLPEIGYEGSVVGSIRRPEVWLAMLLVAVVPTGCFVEFIVGAQPGTTTQTAPCPAGEVLCGEVCAPEAACNDCHEGTVGCGGSSSTSTGTTTGGCAETGQCSGEPPCEGPGCGDGSGGDSGSGSGGEVHFCGDGVVDSGEACDDGDSDDTDACTTLCQPAMCGDGFIGPGEGCDDGDLVDDDECTNKCSPPSCGDGQVQAETEDCDDGNADDSDACLATCVLASCGDGHVQAGVEACDDGNPSDADECTGQCKPPTCVDGALNGAESDIDCGGPDCPACADGSACLNDDDCGSGHCSVGICGYTTTCLEIKQDQPEELSGTFTIDPDGPGDGAPFQVYCDQETDGGGWTMVYKLSTGVAADPYVLWTGGPVNATDETLLGTSKSSKHYVSGFLSKYWNDGGVAVNDARVHLYYAGELERHWRFAAAGTSKWSWFDSSRLLASSYDDLPAGPFNRFSIAGDNWKGTGRRWFINRNYDGCGSDNGWLIVDTDGNFCSWEANNGSPAIRILYSSGSEYTNWSSATLDGTIGVADVFAVFVR
jgi:cysteine-rich repeat protein